MSYVALYNKFRPQSFEDVVGQEIVVKTLQKMIETDKISNGYLFVGGRGLGKTTLARIFSKAINCTGEGVVPCNECPSCKSINNNSSFDLVEMDAASNRGVDDVREMIINKVQYKPRGKYKVYILDEVHMLSDVAWNSLLKTLETPPPYVVFIFCTTNPEKIPKTIISRLQVYYLKNINNDDIVKRLKYICKKEGFKATNESLYSIARYARGGMRDSISALDQISAFTKDINQDDVLSILGMISENDCYELFDSLINNDNVRYTNKLSELVSNNKDILEAYNMLSIMTRVSVNISIGNTDLPSDISAETFEKLLTLGDSKVLKTNKLNYLIELLVDNELNIKRTYDKSMVLLSIMSKYRKGDKNDISDILKRLEALEKGNINNNNSDNTDNIVSDIRKKLQSDDVYDDNPNIAKAKQLKKWFMGKKKGK